MNDFESQLRRALRPIEPPAGFAERVMRALPERRAAAAVLPLPTRAAPTPSLWRRLSTPAALAASLLMAVLFGQHLAIQRFEAEQRAGLAASRELMQALRVTSQKLDLTWQAVQSPPPARAEEENRS
ncbi:MAG TPA: hypothetical protein VFP37_03685 [Steroidobacteraceae bacterium]|nr:hypothetical protein [Steroidobacteraceae bacterium]